MKKNTNILTRTLLSILFFLSAATVALATDYYVTQNGAGSGNGTSIGSAWSVASYNASGTPAGGDTIYFSGTITSTVSPNTSGTGNGTGRLTLDFSGSTLSAANPRIRNSGKSYITYEGGGSWAQGGNGLDSVYTSGCTMGAHSSEDIAVQFNSQSAHDITVRGFQSTLSGANIKCRWLDGRFVNNLLIEDNYVENVSGFYWSDRTSTHDVTIRNNYCKTNANTVAQTDIVVMGDGYNLTIEGNKFVMRAPGNTSVRHNDVIQLYKGGGSGGGNPYGIVIRYNWLELDVSSGSGDTSWFMFEALQSIGSTPALKVYSNVFYGTANDTGSNNGLAIGYNLSSANVYCYNNTVIRRAGPNNTWKIRHEGNLYSRNNIGWAPSSSWDGSRYEMTPGATWDRNFFYNFQAPTSQMAGPNGSRSTNPVFTNAPSDDYSLDASSPLLGAADSSIGSEYGLGIAHGATWPAPTLKSRGSSWDVGAYQSGPTSGTPVDPSELGVGTTP